MSEYFKAAARCDIAVVRKSPLYINEKDIIEEELRVRQFDTLIQRAEHEQNLQKQLKSGTLDAERQREMEERAKALRREAKRQEALEKKEIERQAREAIERRKAEELEMKRLAALEEKRKGMESERETAKLKAQQKQYEAAQRRMRRAVPKSVEQQADELPEDTASLSYMERLRMEKERLGRMEQIHEGNPSVKALYSIELPKLQSPTQLQRDITLRREWDAARLQVEREALMDEDEQDEVQTKVLQKRQLLSRKAAHEEWLARQRAAERAEEAVRAAEEAESPLRPAQHPIDVMHRQVQDLLLAEREAQLVLDENLRTGYSHLDRLEEQLELEREAWREELQALAER